MFLLHFSDVGGYKCGNAFVGNKPWLSQNHLYMTYEVELKQQPMVSMGILKTLSQTRKQKGKYESIPSMNQTNMLEYNELVDGVFQ